MRAADVAATVEAEKDRRLLEFSATIPARGTLESRRRSRTGLMPSRSAGRKAERRDPSSPPWFARSARALIGDAGTRPCSEPARAPKHITARKYPRRPDARRVDVAADPRDSRRIGRVASDRFTEPIEPRNTKPATRAGHLADKIRSDGEYQTWQSW